MTGPVSAAGINIFVNGNSQQKDIARDDLTATIKTDKTFRIGRRYNSSMVNGVEIDEIALYNRVLNHKDVEKLSKVDTLSPLFSKSLKPLANAQRPCFMMSI